MAVCIVASGCETDVADTQQEVRDDIIGAPTMFDDASIAQREDASLGVGPDAAEPCSACDASVDDAAVPVDDVGNEPNASEPKDAGKQPRDPNEIESVAFEQSNGGWPVPMLLFAGGYGSFNVEQLVNPIDIAYDLVEHPAAWPAWRRTAQGVERQVSGGFKPLMYKYECAALPQGTMLSGIFEEFRSVTAGAYGARQTRTRFRFAADGTFESCAMEKTAIVYPGNGNITTKRTQRRGSYEVDEYIIRFVYDDGTGATFPFFFDPTRPTRLWIAKGHFPSPATELDAICVAP